MRAHITALRVRRASELLLATPQQIQQVAGEAGFRTTTEFRQSFHRLTGVTVTEYRQIFVTPVAASAGKKV